MGAAGGGIGRETRECLSGGAVVGGGVDGGPNSQAGVLAAVALLFVALWTRPPRPDAFKV